MLLQRNVTLLIILMFIVSCSSDEKTSVLIIDQLESGAFVRTLSFDNSDLILGDTESMFSVNLEVQDEDEGGLLDNLEVFVTFKDNTLENGNSSSQEVLFKTIERDVFTNGALNLPITNLSATYSELASVTQTPLDEIHCKDQFIVRLNLNLIDGRSFSIDDGSSSVVIAFDTLFSSPFCYTVNITAPITTNNFVGMYRYESIIDGPIGPTFGESKIVEIQQDPNSVNSRIFEADYIVSRQNEPSRPFRFLIACEEVIFQKNQLSSFFSWCRPEGGFSLGGPPILLGPDTTNSTINPNDDSSFELTFVEGYMGWDGDCDFGVVPVKILFTKQ